MLKKDKAKIKEHFTNISDLGQLPASEVQLVTDVVYNSILEEICSVVPMESPRQIISGLRLKFGSKDKKHNSKRKWYST